MNSITQSKISTPKQIALGLLVLTTILIGTSNTSNAQLFRRSNAVVGGFSSNNYWNSRPVQTSNYRTPRPVTGYGANFHRNFVIRQQQQRSQAGGSLISRGNVLWRR